MIDWTELQDQEVGTWQSGATAEAEWQTPFAGGVAEAEIAPARPELAPDFVRHVPSAAIEADERHDKAEEFRRQARHRIAEQWRQVRQSEIDGLAAEYLEPGAWEEAQAMLPQNVRMDPRDYPGYTGPPTQDRLAGELRQGRQGEVGGPLEFLQSRLSQYPEDPFRAALGTVGELVAEAPFRLARQFAETAPGVKETDVALRREYGPLGELTPLDFGEFALGMAGPGLPAKGGKAAKAGAEAADLLTDAGRKAFAKAHPGARAVLNERTGTVVISRNPRVKLDIDEFGALEREVREVVVGLGGIPASTGSRAGRFGYLEVEALEDLAAQAAKVPVTDAQRAAFNADITPGKASSGELMRGLGRFNLTADMQDDLRRAWQELGQKPETISWDETLRDIAPRLGETPDTLAAKWADAPRGELTAALATGKAGLARYEGMIARLEQKLIHGMGSADDELEIQELIFKRNALLVGLRRDAGEVGRALNFLRMGVETQHARLAETQYAQVAEVAKQAEATVRSGAKGGKVSTKGRQRLQDISDKLTKEIEREGPVVDTRLLDTEAGKPARRARATHPTDRVMREIKQRDPSLAEQLAKLNREQTLARDKGDWNLVDEIEERRQGLIPQIEDAMRTKLQKSLERENKPATWKDVDKLMGRGIESQIMAAVREEMLSVQEQADAVSLARGLDKGFARQMRDRIDSLLKVGGSWREMREEAEILLRELSTLSGDAEKIANDYRRSWTAAQARRAIGGKGAEAMTPEIMAEFSKIDMTDPRAAAMAADLVNKGPSMWGQIPLVRTASLLSGPATQIQNIVGNVAFMAAAPPLRLLSAAIEDGLTLHGKLRPREATYSMAAKELTGYVRAFDAAITEAQTTWRTHTSMQQLRDLSTYTTDPIKIPIFKPLNLVFRGLGAADDFFTTLNRSGALLAEAERKASKAGISAESILMNIIDHPDVLNRAVKEAERRTFRSELPLVGRAVNMARADPVVHTIIPFFNTNANIAKLGIGDFGPLAPVRIERARRSGDLAAAADARGDALLGAGLMTIGGILSASGVFPGYGPTDAREKEAMEATGWGPGKVLTGDIWTPVLNLAGPFGIPLFIGAVAQEAMANGAKGEKVEKLLGKAVHDMGWITMSQSGLKGVQDVFRLLGDPGRNLEYWSEAQASSWVPYGGLLATLTRGIDPTIRDPENALQAIVARLPLVSKMIPESVDVWGESRERAVSGPLAALPTSGMARATDDPVRLEVARLQAAGFDVAPLPVGKNLVPGRGMEPVRLTEQEWRGYQTMAGRQAHEWLTEWMADPDWRMMPDTDKVEIIEEVIRNARKQAADKVRPALYDRTVEP